MAVNGFKHFLSKEGYNIRQQIATLNAENEFRFTDLLTRFIKELETDIKLKKSPPRIGINEYISKNAGTIIGGKKEKVEEDLNRIYNMLDFEGQSEVVALYAWIIRNNFNVKLLHIHNKILARLRSLDSELLTHKNKTMTKVSYIFKDIVDLVGKFVNQRALDLFIEKIEREDNYRRGGFRDKKVRLVTVLKCALMAAFESSNINEENQQMIGDDENDPNRLTYYKDDHKYTLTKAKTDKKPEGNTLSKGKAKEEEAVVELREVSKFDPHAANEKTDMDRGTSKDRGGSKDKTGQRKVAGRYFFEKNTDLEELKNKVKEDEEGDPEKKLKSQMDILDKAHEEALKKSEELDDLYETVVRMFNEAKKNYVNLGKEVGHCNRFSGFMKRNNKDDREMMRTIKEVEFQDIPDIKKIKLVEGMVLEKASNEIYYDGQQIFKFQLDKDDYDNQPFKENAKQNTVYDLMNKNPPDISRGVKNARNVVREMKEIQGESPLKGREREAATQDEEELALLKRSAYYGSKDKKKQNQVDDYSRRVSADRVDEDILKGMGLMIISNYLVDVMSPKRRRKSSKKGENDDSKGKRKETMGPSKSDVERLVKRTLSKNKRENFKDFEEGRGANFVEFETGASSEDEDNQDGPVFGSDRKKERRTQGGFGHSGYNESERRLPKLDGKSGKKHNDRQNGTIYVTPDYVLYEAQDPAFAIYTNVRLTNLSPISKRRTAKQVN
jgi:hypothetical protein